MSLPAPWPWPWQRLLAVTSARHTATLRLRRLHPGHRQGEGQVGGRGVQSRAVKDPLDRASYGETQPRRAPWQAGDGVSVSSCLELRSSQRRGYLVTCLTDEPGPRMGPEKACSSPFCPSGPRPWGPSCLRRNLMSPELLYGQGHRWARRLCPGSPGWAGGRPRLQHRLCFWKPETQSSLGRGPGPRRLRPAGPEPRGAPLSSQPAEAPLILEAGGRPRRPPAVCRLLPSKLC